MPKMKSVAGHLGIAICVHVGVCKINLQCNQYALSVFILDFLEIMKRPPVTLHSPDFNKVAFFSQLSDQEVSHQARLQLPLTEQNRVCLQSLG